MLPLSLIVFFILVLKNKRVGGERGEFTKITLYHWIDDLCNILLLTSHHCWLIGSWFSNKCGTTGGWVENDLRDRQTYLNAILSDFPDHHIS